MRDYEHKFFEEDKDGGYHKVCECFVEAKIVIFYTEILTIKVVLWYFFTSEMSKKSTIQLFEKKS